MSSESFLVLSSSTSSTSSSSTGRTSTEVVFAGLGRTRTPAVTLVVIVVLVILVILVVPVGLEDRRKSSRESRQQSIHHGGARHVTYLVNIFSLQTAKH